MEISTIVYRDGLMIVTMLVISYSVHQVEYQFHQNLKSMLVTVIKLKLMEQREYRGQSTCQWVTV